MKVDAGVTLEESVQFDFTSQYTENFPEILNGLNISLAVTSYQAQRLFFVRSDGRKIDTFFKYFPRPMGIYADQQRLTLGTLSKVIEFRRNEELLQRVKNGDLDDTEKMTKKVREKDDEKKQLVEERRAEELHKVKQADALYLSRASLTTGMINIHDIAWGDDGLWVVNSTFSCLATLSPGNSFIARWKPSFITELVPEDRCHLNGMALKNGKPKYVTTFNKFNSRDSWVNQDLHDGSLIDVETNKVLVDDMIMPHSPRYYRGKVYMCNSGLGSVLEFDPSRSELKEIIQLPGFPRGLNFLGPLMFVGLSKTRPSKTRQQLPINTLCDQTKCGLYIINLENNEIVAYLHFTGDIEQIYDIAVIPDATFPELFNSDDILTRHLYDFREEL